MTKPIELTIMHDNITDVGADVVALKHAQDFYGADDEVARRLEDSGVSLEEIRPGIGAHVYLETRGAIRARHVLFIGTKPLLDLRYGQIRQLAADVLGVLSKVAPQTRHLAMTIHGPGYGLDEVEAIWAQFGGFLEALDSERCPTELRRISVVEIDASRVQRLSQALETFMQGAAHLKETRHGWRYDAPATSSQSASPVGRGQAIEVAGVDSEAKAHAFVAMPFGEETDDVFYYGVQEPVRAAGLLCERVDQDVFTGSILEHVKKRIDDAAVVIADLSGANPNVYLEVGYAWGRGVPTILLVRNTDELRFDVSSERCLPYARIKDLEESLRIELAGLMDSGTIKR